LIASFKAQKKPDLATSVPNSNVSSGPTLRDLAAPIDGGTKFQYAIVNVGTFNNADRMREALATAGRGGWELVTIYDKASNWVGGWEKGFMLLKRPVPDGVRPDSWCLMIRS
jgi:hypothetical protein